MKSKIFEAYKKTIAKKEVLDEATTSVEAVLNRYISGSKQLDSAGKKEAKILIKEISNAMSKMDSAIDDMQDLLGDALAPGFQFTLGKYLLSKAKMLHKGV